MDRTRHYQTFQETLGCACLIVYRNRKPQLVVDYRKLNEIAIWDEFPLAKQENILQALEGSQWLS